MRNIFIAILLATVATSVQAQPLSMPELKNKKTSLYFVLTGGVLFNMNAKDRVLPTTGFLKVENTTGYKAGIEMLVIPRRRIPVFLNVGMEYRRVPHVYKLRYGSNVSGLGSDVNEDIKFASQSVAMRVAPVYTLRLSANSNLDISVGALFDAAVNVNKAYTEEGAYAQDKKTGYNQLAAFRYTGYGSDIDSTSLPRHPNVGMNLMFYGSVSYRVSPRFMGKRILRVGAEYGAVLMGNRASQTAILYLDKNRNIIAKDWVSDKGANISVFLGVSI